ncbi:MAG: hypothetical protein ACI9HI_002015 [Salinirussus sp.]|jgi:hypothetical protein
MLPAPLRKAGYAFVAAYGLFAALAPRLASSLGVRTGLLGFENAADLEAQDWYVRAVRASGVGMVAAGGVGLLLEGRASDGDDRPEPGAIPDDEATETDDGPVSIDV